MFRKDNQDAVSKPEPTAHAHHDWDGRIKRAHASETAWKRATLLVFGALCISAVWNVRQAGEVKVQMIHVLHGSTGETMSINVANGSSVQPTQAMLAAEMREWISDIRTVGIDVLALRRAIERAFDRVDKGSQAQSFLVHYYNDNNKAKEPFHRATTETVSLRNVEADPPPPVIIGPDGLQTWDIRWIEDVLSRDGQSITSTAISAKVTFRVVTPTSYAEAVKSPNGVHIISVSWTN